MAPSDRLTYSLKASLQEAIDLRCMDCPATLASQTNREVLGYAGCSHLFVPKTVSDDEEQGCRKGAAQENTIIVDFK